MLSLNCQLVTFLALVAKMLLVKRFVFCYAFLLFEITMAQVLEIRELKLPQGAIKGAKRESIYNEHYYSFEGIPFGKPPVGDLRFKAPQPAEPWSVTLDCTTPRNKPLQLNDETNKFEGSEDCLYLNVYAKTLKSNKPLPVMVFIYGGGFYFGEATRDWYSPDYFMHEDVILVTFNYRLLSLGFLSLKDPKLGIPGNAALKDQVLAIKWVKQYISHFNGDPENITVFGESAGAASAHYMMLTEQTRGLFQRAILMSGVALNFWATLPQPDMAFRLAKYHNYTGQNVDKSVVAFLQTLPAEKLITYDILNDEERRNGYYVAFNPVVEPYVGPDCVVPKSPFVMLKTTWSNSIPLLIGGNSDEGLSMYLVLKLMPELMNAFKQDMQRFLPAEVRRNHTEAENQVLSEKLKRLHFGDKELNEQSLMQFVDYFKYKVFWHDIQRTVLARLKYAKQAPTYLYRFSFDSPDFNLFRKIFCGTDPVRGACHADDLCYLFYSKMAWRLPQDSAEFKTIERMVSLWTSFAKNSNPNSEATKPAAWRPLQCNDPYRALNINNNLQVMQLPEKNKLEVWNSLYKADDLY